MIRGKLTDVNEADEQTRQGSDEELQRWEELGEKLIARRVALGYRQRIEFARDHGLRHDRVLSDIEKARRTNFDDGTIAQVEQIYRLRSGAVKDFFRTGALAVEETVVPSAETPGVLLSLPPDALDGLSATERAEALSVATATLLERIREIRRRQD